MDIRNNPFSVLDKVTIAGGQDLSEISEPYQKDNGAPETSADSDATRERRHRSRSVKRKTIPTSTPLTKKTRATKMQQPNQVTGGASAARDDPGPPVADPFDRMQAFMEQQFRQTNENIAEMSGSIAKMDEKVTINSRNINRLKDSNKNLAEKTTAEIMEVRSLLLEKNKEREDDIARLKESIYPKEKLEQDICDQIKSKRSAPTEPTQDGGYWLARRSLRCWPIRGRAEKDIWKSVGSFFSSNMRIPNGVLCEKDVECIRRITPRNSRPRSLRNEPNTPVHDEAVVVFSNVELRDMVFSYAYNLGQFIDDDGRPTAGVRMEIPDALRPTFQDLQAYGGVLRTKHGKGLKRSVRYDDSAKTLYMNVKLPNSEEWLHVDHKLALEERPPPKKRSLSYSRMRLASSCNSEETDVEMIQPIPTQRDLPASPKRQDNRDGNNELPKSNTLQKYNPPRDAAPEWGNFR